MAQVLRSLVFVVVQILTAPVYSSLTLLILPLPLVLRLRIISGWARFMCWNLRVVCGIDHQVEGLERLPTQASVILSKHQSAWETIVFQTIFPPHVWVLKRELLWIPFFGWGLMVGGAVAIDRGAGIRALDSVVKQGRRRLAQGAWVMVFPEGTRMPAGEKGRYNPGGALLAEKAGVPVVPVAHNAGLYWPKRGFLKRPGTVHVVIGEPIQTQGRRAREINAEAERWIEGEMAKLVPTRVGTEPQD